MFLSRAWEPLDQPVVDCVFPFERFALHKIGIHMRAVVSVEILDDVRAAMPRKWPNQFRAYFTILSVGTPTVNPPLGHSSHWSWRVIASCGDEGRWNER